MTFAFLDTHTWAWSLDGNRRLSQTAQRLIEDADTVLISPVSFYEIAQKVRIGKWPEMKGPLSSLLDLVQRQGSELASLDADICLRAASMDWPHRDPFDRMLAATALRYDVAIISIDTVFDDVVRRIW